MKLFISWSGNRSHRVAQLLEQWIPTVTAGVTTWLSSRDIESGATWFREITETLGETTQGIFCLTRENIDKPWILFEAGALAKGSSESRVRTLLIDLRAEDVHDPLAQFNHTFPVKESMLALIRNINNSVGDKKIPDHFLAPAFEKEWPAFEAALAAILSDTPVLSNVAPRTVTEMMAEVLEGVRGIDKQMASLSFKQTPDYKPHYELFEKGREVVIHAFIRDALFEYFRTRNFTTTLSQEEKLQAYYFLCEKYNEIKSYSAERVIDEITVLFNLRAHLSLNPHIAPHYFYVMPGRSRIVLGAPSNQPVGDYPERLEKAKEVLNEFKELEYRAYMHTAQALKDKEVFNEAEITQILKVAFPGIPGAIRDNWVQNLTQYFPEQIYPMSTTWGF